MKATIDIPNDLYRQVKVKSALEGRPVREVAIHLFQHWVEESKTKESSVVRENPAETRNPPIPAWFGVLRKYTVNTRKRHDMKSIRKSIARGIARERGL